MSNLNDERVLNAILNPNTPFEETQEQKSVSKYEINADIQEVKKLEIEGVRAAQTGDFKNSIEFFNKAIEKAPHWASSYNNRAQVLRLSGETDRTSIENLESLNERHRREKKELQSKIQSLKKSVTKGDKKKKKEIDAEIEKLEKEFEEKCQLEIKKITDTMNNTTENVIEKSQDLNETESVEKTSKSKKRREKKENKELERERTIALQEIENQKGPAAIELNKIKEKLVKRGLKIKEVISDGNCMYYAVSDQVKKCMSMSKSFQELRELTCNYMLRNPAEFQPYVTSDDGDFLDSEKYEEYCIKIKNTTVWGGQLELKALSDILGTTIEVVQAEGPQIVIGEGKKSENPLVITYHRHMLGSGEHYNSTEPDITNLDKE